MELAVFFVGVLVVATIFGLISKAISKSRGMEGGFWWGFFLGLIGIIVVAVRPKDNKTATGQVASSPYEDLERITKLKEQGLLSDDEYNKMKAECLARIK